MKRISFLVLVLSLSLVIGAALMAGCTAEAPVQITENVTAREAFTLIQDNLDNPDFVVIDVRTPEEFAEGHIKNAVNLDNHSASFRDVLNILDKDKTYLIYCRSGQRSANTLNIMKELNFKKIYHMNGGILEWVEEELPVVK